MTDEEALLAAICAKPLEDTPRLAYADWLDEHADPSETARPEPLPPAAGKPKRAPRKKKGAVAKAPGARPVAFRAQRAELIRAQIALESIPRADPRFAPLEARAYELIDTYAPFWYPRGMKLRERTEWDRGFPVPDMPGEQLRTDKYLGRVPLWRLTSQGSDAFLSAPYLHRVGSLLVYGNKPAGTVERVAGCAALCNVTELAFTAQTIAADLLRAVLDAWTDRRLRLFWANSCSVRLAGCKVLATHPATANLKLLRVHTAQIGSRGLKVLLESGRFNNLRLATFAHNQTGDAGARHLLNWPALDTIPALYLMNMGFSAKVLDQLRERLGERVHL
jgi:uncharacterized protein (TIGR02996 family)